MGQTAKPFNQKISGTKDPQSLVSGNKTQEMKFGFVHLHYISRTLLDTEEANDKIKRVKSLRCSNLYLYINKGSDGYSICNVKGVAHSEKPRVSAVSAVPLSSAELYIIFQLNVSVL